MEVVIIVFGDSDDNHDTQCYFIDKVSKRHPEEIFEEKEKSFVDLM